MEEECRLTQDSKASRDARNITEVRKKEESTEIPFYRINLIFYLGIGLFARPLEHQETV